MSKMLWIKGAQTIAGKPAIRLTNGEKALVGKHGEIWENGDRFKAVITNAYIAKANVPPKLAPVNFDDETVISFPKEELDHWCAVLAVYQRRSEQVRYANKFK